PLSNARAPSSNGFTPIQRTGPGPWILRLVEPIATPDKVVGGGEIVGGIRNDATPSIVSRTRFQRAHQAQLKGVAAVLFQHADTAEISGVVWGGGRNAPG